MCLDNSVTSLINANSLWLYGFWWIVLEISLLQLDSGILLLLSSQPLRKRPEAPPYSVLWPQEAGNSASFEVFNGGSEDRILRMEATFHELAQSDIFGHVIFIHFRYEEFDSFSVPLWSVRTLVTVCLARDLTEMLNLDLTRCITDMRPGGTPGGTLGGTRYGKAKECLTWNWLDGSGMNWTNPSPFKDPTHDVFDVFENMLSLVVWRLNILHHGDWSNRGSQTKRHEAFEHGLVEFEHVRTV